MTKDRESIASEDAVENDFCECKRSIQFLCFGSYYTYTDTSLNIDGELICSGYRCLDMRADPKRRDRHLGRLLSWFRKDGDDRYGVPRTGNKRKYNRHEQSRAID